MHKILIVDDELSIRQLLKQMIERNGFTCSLASSAEEARFLLKREKFELMLCDINMPAESGIELIRETLSSNSNLAVIMVTAVNDPETARLALELGAYDYITKPFDRNRILISIYNALRRLKLEIENKQYTQSLKKLVEERTLHLNHTLERLQKTLQGTIQAIALTVEARDPYTSGHQKRVSELAAAIAKVMKLKESQIEAVQMSGSIHDLGKISIPAEILSKPGKLTQDEFQLVKKHPQTGFEILNSIEFPWPIARIVLEHHERMDGSGYPQGLSGEKIILEARILAVADVVEAMFSHRPYRPAFSLEKALQEIEENKGRLYDEEVSRACLEIFKKRGLNLKLFNEIGLKNKEKFTCSLEV